MKTLIFDLEGTLVALKPRLTCFADLAYLSMLRTKYDFAMVTGSSKAEVLYALGKCGLADLFGMDKIITGDDMNGDKASGVPFFEIKRRIAGDMVMVGDSEGDEIGTRKAKIPFVKVDSMNKKEAQRLRLRSSIEKAVTMLENL